MNGVPTASLPKPTATISAGGSGYTSAPAVTIDPPAIGVTMTATATISGGAVTAITVNNPGTNYAATPSLTIAAPASGTQATGAITALGSTWPASVLNEAMDRTIDSTGGANLLGELSAYVKACYNIGFHLLLVFAADPSGGTFFKTTRATYKLTQFRPGIVMAAGDQATSQTFIVPEFFQHITLEALEATKTPWGRQWVEYQQMYGQTIWDMS